MIRKHCIERERREVVLTHRPLLSLSLLSSSFSPLSISHFLLSLETNQPTKMEALQPNPPPVLQNKAAEECAAADDDDDDSMEEKEEQEECYGGVKKKKKVVFVCGGGSGGKKGCGGSGGGGGRCQAEKCAADLTEAKRYHRRHKVCELHAKASVVMVAGLRQRFCQQCSSFRFHELSEFDNTKRSCRTRLAGHNERRRKSSSESRGEGSGSGCPSLSLQLSQSQADDHYKGKKTSLTAFPGKPTYKQFHIH
ncbi:unnamed protein product [Camellia sinensis]